MRWWPIAALLLAVLFGIGAAAEEGARYHHRVVTSKRRSLKGVHAASAGWIDLHPTGAPDVITDLSCIDPSLCFVPSAANGVGASQLLTFDGQVNGVFTLVSTPVTPMTFMSSAVQGTPAAPKGAVGGMGVLGTAMLFAVNSRTFLPSEMDSLMSAEQSIASDKSGNVVVGVDNLANIAFVSVDAGARFQAFPIATPNGALTCVAPRGVAVADNHTFYISWGSWASNSNSNSVFVKGRKVLSATRSLEIGADGKMRRIKTLVPQVCSGSGAAGCGYSAAITKTTDGGKTWTSVYVDNTDFYFNQISCWTPTLCVAVAEGLGVRAGIRFFHTTDGATWKQVFEQLSDAQNGYIASTVQFASATEVWVGGANQGNSSSNTGEALMFHSKDGGATWAKFMHGIPNIVEVTGLSFVLSSNGAVGFASAIVNNNAASTILRFNRND